MLNRIRIFFQDHFSSFRMILIGFFLIILAGAFLLSLPVSDAAGEGTPFLDALFTATSALCVTGLIVFDTATHWSLFGKIIIFILIQIGGLGVITIAVATVFVTGRKIGIIQRLFLQNSVSSPMPGDVAGFTKFFIKGTLIVELAGALLLLPVFVPQFGPVKGLVYSVFHSVSAFCNAGFDLMGVREPFSSFTGMASNSWLNIVICTLILVGGAGFFTWKDLLEKKFDFSRLRLQSKVILYTSVILIILPFIYFYVIEFAGYPRLERFLYSMFQSITPRTAGFNTFNYGDMSESGQFITILLMLVGGAPGSTAGGMKITTIFVITVAARSFMYRNENVNCFKRRVENDEIRNAFSLFVIYIGTLIGGTLLIANVEKLPLVTSMFETASALCTVGLTTGITPGLCAFSKIVLICFMYFGRVGGLTMSYAFTSKTKIEHKKYPAENMTVG